MRILIVKRDKLGDMLLTTPLIAGLRRALPDAEVSVLASDYCGWVVKADPDLAHLWTYPRLRLSSLLRPAEIVRYRRAFSEVRRVRFDAAIAAGGDYSPRAVEKALAAGAARTIAYAPAGHPYGARLTDRMEPPQSGHETDRMLALAKPLGVDLEDLELFPRFALPSPALSFRNAWLAERGLQPGGYVVLGLGARKRVRQPSTEQVLRWTARWREAHGLQTVFMWTPGKGSPLYPGDDEVAEPVLAAKRADIHPFRGPIPEALGLIWGAAASVFPDSGLMHFAAASPGGVVGLFSAASTSPEQWAPRGARARWVLAPQTVPELGDDSVFTPLQRLLAEGVSLAVVKDEPTGRASLRTAPG